MDVRMPIMDGIEATRRVVRPVDGRPARVLVMTTFDIDEHIIDALRAGASGFLVKDSPPEDLVRAVRIIAAGEAVLAPSVTRRLLDLRAGTLPPVAVRSPDAAVAGITARERTVLRLVARGLPNAEIAHVMDLAPSSVKTHVGHLLAKLGFTDRVQLVVFAYEHELVRPGSPEPEAPDGPTPPRRPVPRRPDGRRGRCLRRALTVGRGQSDGGGMDGAVGTPPLRLPGPAPAGAARRRRRAAGQRRCRGGLGLRRRAGRGRCCSCSAAIATGFALRYARLHSSAEALAAAAAALALAGSAPGGLTLDGEPVTAAVLAVVLLGLHWLSPHDRRLAARRLGGRPARRPPHPGRRPRGAAHRGVPGRRARRARDGAVRPAGPGADRAASRRRRGGWPGWEPGRRRRGRTPVPCAWLSALLVIAAAAGLLPARLREPLDPLLGPPRAVPVLAGVVAGVAAVGPFSSLDPVVLAVTGFVGVLLATLPAAC